MPKHLIQALGEAVVAKWGALSPEAQHDLFEAAVQAGGEARREELALFLHDRHPRTSREVAPPAERREAPEPDSLGG